LWRFSSSFILCQQNTLTNQAVPLKISDRYIHVVTVAVLYCC
jgi:hypothetical protein